MSDKFDRFIDTLKSAIDDGRCGDRAVIDAVKAVSDENDDDGNGPIELFVGARCLNRLGAEVVIESLAGANWDPYRFVAVRCNEHWYYMANGNYWESGSRDNQDLVKILNPEDRPKPKDDGPIELFIGAKCIARNGDIVTITSKCADSEPYEFNGCDGCQYLGDGRFDADGEYSEYDIIRILNPEDRPKPSPPVKYRSVNKSDIDKEVEVLFDDGWTACTLKAIMKTPAPDGSSISVWCDDTIDGAGSYTCLNEEVRIVARDDDKVMKNRWVNMYDDCVCGAHDKRHADIHADQENRRACVKVEYYDGQYDE